MSSKSLICDCLILPESTARDVGTRVDITIGRSLVRPSRGRGARLGRWSRTRRASECGSLPTNPPAHLPCHSLSARLDCPIAEFPTRPYPRILPPCNLLMEPRVQGEGSNPYSASMRDWPVSASEPFPAQTSSTRPHSDSAHRFARSGTVPRDLPSVRSPFWRAPPRRKVHACSGT